MEVMTLKSTPRKVIKSPCLCAGTDTYTFEDQVTPIHFFNTKKYTGLDHSINKLFTHSQASANESGAYRFQVLLRREERVGVGASSRDAHATADRTIFSVLQISTY